jgi:Protein of unknown function (DUF3800)
VFLVYLDDSRDEELCVFSGLIVPAAVWRDCFDALRDFRRDLKASDGIYVRKELHAWKFVSGRGRVSDRVVTKYRRCEIFKEALGLTASMRVRIINGVSTADDDERLFEWIANRIQATMGTWNSHAMLICDEGKEASYTRLIRRMGVYNPIPSRLGSWPEGTSTRNITVDRIVEDPFFKDSQRSYFIQLVDFCAYALLRRERPIPSKSRYGLDTAFELLDGVLLKQATAKDPQGVLRPPARRSS